MAEPHVLSATPGRVPGGLSPRARRVALAAVLLTAIVATALWLAFRPADTRLWESIWELESATYDGAAVSIETNDAPVTWQFDRVCESGVGTGPGCADFASLTVRGGCGWLTTGVVYDEASVHWTGDAREIAPGCVGEITRAVIAVGGSGSFDVGFDDERLVATAPDESGELVFRPVASRGWGGKGD